MIRTEEFRISKRPYAVALGSFRRAESGRWDVDAVWFRRRSGVTAACLGPLWGYMSGDREPADVLDFLARWDGRYGGDCLGRWNGRGYWGSESPDVQAQHLAVLKPMLAAFPALPAGYDGWWGNA